MKEYKLLLNQTYLYVLQNQYQKPNFSEIAHQIGLTRQTVSRQYEEFKDLSPLNYFNITNFYNEETNKYKRAILILNDICDEQLTQDNIAQKLGISRATVNKAYNNIAVPCIYAIKDKNQVVYIGSTADFETRKNIHMLNIKNKAYSFCSQDATIEIIWQECKSKEERLRLEAQLIRIFQPIGNIEFNKVGKI